MEPCPYFTINHSSLHGCRSYLEVWSFVTPSNFLEFRNASCPQCIDFTLFISFPSLVFVCPSPPLQMKEEKREKVHYRRWMGRQSEAILPPLSRYSMRHLLFFLSSLVPLTWGVDRAISSWFQWNQKIYSMILFTCSMIIIRLLVPRIILFKNIVYYLNTKIVLTNPQS